MATGGESEDDGGLERNKKKVRQVAEEIGGENSSFSYKDKLIGEESFTRSQDSKGRSVFDNAWKEHIDGLKGFFSDGDTNEKQQEEVNDEDCPTMVVSQEEYESWCVPWRKSLILKVLGKSNIPLWGMRRCLARIWKTKEPYQCRDLDNGYFVVSFNTDEDLEYVFFEGPWMVGDRYLLVQRWRPNFDPWHAETQKKIAAWVRIPWLPLEFFNPVSLKKIGSLIGKTLKIDPVTYLGERGRYARICVELDLQKKLKSGVNIFGRRRVVEYEGLHLICFCCGRYGHHRNVCPDRVWEMEDTPGQSTGGVNHNQDENKSTERLKEGDQIIAKEKGESSASGGLGESQKRTRDCERAGVNSGEMAMIGVEKLGLQNLVKRPNWRKSGKFEIPGGREKNQPKSLKNKVGVSQQRDTRDSKIVGVYGGNQSGKFVFNANDIPKSSGKVLNNKNEWVPVEGKKNSRVNIKVNGKEVRSSKIRPNHINSVVGPSKEKIDLNNSFWALEKETHSRDEENKVIDDRKVQGDEAHHEMDIFYHGDSGHNNRNIEDLQAKYANGGLDGTNAMGMDNMSHDKALGITAHNLQNMS